MPPALLLWAPPPQPPSSPHSSLAFLSTTASMPASIFLSMLCACKLCGYGCEWVFEHAFRRACVRASKLACVRVCARRRFCIRHDRGSLHAWLHLGTGRTRGWGCGGCLFRLCLRLHRWQKKTSLRACVCARVVAFVFAMTGDPCMRGSPLEEEGRGDGAMGAVSSGCVYVCTGGKKKQRQGGKKRKHAHDFSHAPGRPP